MVKGCKFCDISEGTDEKTVLLYKDELLMVFKDIKPASKHHYLVCPRKHIQDAKALKKDDLELLELMVVVGKQVLEEQGGDVSNTRIGFHWPPFVSVWHLHLHIISPVESIGFFTRVLGKYNHRLFIFTSVDYMRDRLQKMPESGL